MPNWNENEFVARAQELAKQHVASKTSLNDLSEKVARDEALNPEEIRTLVRLANVATFQEMFKGAGEKQSSDRMIEFETGDAEAVIRRIVSEPVPAELRPATVTNDKLAHDAYSLPDQMRDTRRGFSIPEEAEKVASEEPERAPRPDMVVLNLQKLAREFEMARLSAGRQWEEKLAAIVSTLNRAPGYGPRYDEFEKDAFAELGEDVRPEMDVLLHDLRFKGLLPDRNKVAELQERHVVLRETPALRMVKEAVELRRAYTKYKNGSAWIKANMPALGR